jgi:hypothetical protein
MARLIDAGSGAEVKPGDALMHGIKVLSVKPAGFLGMTKVRVEYASVEDNVLHTKTIDCPVTFLHPHFLFEPVAFLPT